MIGAASYFMLAAFLSSKPATLEVHCRICFKKCDGG